MAAASVDVVGRLVSGEPGAVEQVTVVDRLGAELVVQRAGRRLVVELVTDTGARAQQPVLLSELQDQSCQMLNGTG